MILILIGVAILAAFVTYGTGLFVPAVIVAILSIWSNGVLANYRRGEWASAPDWAAAVSFLSTVGALGLLIGGLVAS